MSESHFKSMIPNQVFKDNFDKVFGKASSNAIVEPEVQVQATEADAKVDKTVNPRNCIS